jgi:hypothetical protein
VNEAENASGAGSGYASDRYHRYLEEAGDQIYLLSSVLSSGEIERLIATKLYSMLLSLDPSSVSTVTLARLVDGELAHSIQRLKTAEDRIAADMRRWEHGNAVAVVLDTNVWLKYYDDPLQVDLNEVLGESATVPLVVTVPMKVVDELDGHKRNRANSPKGGLQSGGVPHWHSSSLRHGLPAPARESSSESRRLLTNRRLQTSICSSRFEAAADRSLRDAHSRARAALFIQIRKCSMYNFFCN